MAIRGTPNTSSITLVSGSKPPTTATTLSVIIRPPQASPYTGRVATIVFDFEDGAGTPAPVSGFGIGSLIGDPGGEIFRFTKVSNSRYTCDVRFQKRTGPWTITVKANAATLIADPNVTGPPADTSATINLGIVAPVITIGVPAGRPITVRPVPLTFDWTYTDGTPVPMQNFDVTDVSTDVGTIGNFAHVTGDASKYTADLTIPPSNTRTKVTITVSAESAQVANSNPAVLGPLEDTHRTFEIAAPTTLATVTGADSVCVLEKEIVDNDFLNEVGPHLGDNAGGAFTGILESVSIADYLYLVVQVRKFTQTVDADGDLVTPANPENFLSNEQAGAALVRVNTVNCQFEILKVYSDVALAARSLEVDSTTLYFFEGSHYVYEDSQFSDPKWREKIGYVYKIEHPSRTIQAVGRNYRSATTTDNPDTETTDYFYGVHGATTAPIAIANEALHIITGYGNFDDIGQPRGEYPVNRIGNHNWIQYHDQINQRLSEIRTNGRTGFDILKDIAIVTNSIIGFKNNTFFMRPREPKKARNGGGSGITATQTYIIATDLNWGQFPSEGWLSVDGELIKHTGAGTNGRFSNVTRGDAETTAAVHTGTFDIIFVDHILSLNQGTLEMPIKRIIANNDNRQHYNRVRLRYGDDETVSVEDATSIAENGARLLEVTVPLDSHQRVWAEWLAHSYLARFKEGHQILNLTLKPTYYVHVGDVIVIQIPERLHLHNTLCQVLEIRHSLQQPPTTALKLVTL